MERHNPIDVDEPEIDMLTAIHHPFRYGNRCTRR
jgi:hypothetical protein